jgi:hypothetical protein
MVNEKRRRIVTKIGDVFCAELNGTHKCFFQYVANDFEQLNSSVIRVFRRKYPIDYKPVMDEIINGTVAFYAHTVLRAGIEFNAWSKVGKATIIDEEATNRVLFGETSDTMVVSITDIKDVNPLENWWIHRINEPAVNVGKLPEKYIDVVEIDGVLPYTMITTRMEYGYYKGSDINYDVIKRIPWPESNSYTKKEDNGIMHYYHFFGENVCREVVVNDNEAIKLSKDKPVAGSYMISKKKFYETNWKYLEFITETEFKNIWDS